MFNLVIESKNWARGPRIDDMFMAGKEDLYGYLSNELGDIPVVRNNRISRRKRAILKVIRDALKDRFETFDRLECEPDSRVRNRNLRRFFAKYDINLVIK